MTEYVGAIEKQTLENTFFRQVLFTAQHSQLVVMCLRPGEEIGDEVHPKVDQFFRIEQGEAKFVFDEKKERQARDGDAVVGEDAREALRDLLQLQAHRQLPSLVERKAPAPGVRERADRGSSGVSRPPT